MQKQALGTAIKYGCKIFINTHTFFVKAIEYLWNSENMIYKSAHTTSKYLFSLIVRDQIEKWNISLSYLQLVHLYESRDREYKFLNYILRKLKENKQEIALMEGKQIRKVNFGEKEGGGYYGKQGILL